MWHKETQQWFELKDPNMRCVAVDLIRRELEEDGKGLFLCNVIAVFYFTFNVFLLFYLTFSRARQVPRSTCSAYLILRALWFSKSYFAWIMSYFTFFSCKHPPLPPSLNSTSKVESTWHHIIIYCYFYKF